MVAECDGQIGQHCAGTPTRRAISLVTGGAEAHADRSVRCSRWRRTFTALGVFDLLELLFSDLPALASAETEQLADILRSDSIQSSLHELLAVRQLL
jgi:hypothetical protein